MVANLFELHHCSLDAIEQYTTIVNCGWQIMEWTWSSMSIPLSVLALQLLHGAVAKQVLIFAVTLHNYKQGNKTFDLK